MTEQQKTLTDQIYEAALVPELWPTVMEELCAFSGGVGASMFTTDFRQVPSWVSNESYRGVFSDWLSEGWLARAERPRRLIKLPHAGFITVRDVFSDDELRTDVEHNEFLKPRGLGISTGTFIPMPTGDIVVYSIEARLGAHPFTAETIARLDGLRPHLARAGTIAVRLGLERARAAAEAFAVIGLPAAALSERGRVLAANALFEKLIPLTFQDRSERLAIQTPGADRLFAEALARARFQPAVSSIPVPAREGTVPIVVHLVPVKGQAHDIFNRVHWLCIGVPVQPNEVPGAEVLQGLFDLTPAEAKVARAVAQAKTIETLAATLGLSRETIRSQLKSVFAKTGVTRQAELAAMLSGVRIHK